jgi:hypothetical protein
MHLPSLRRRRIAAALAGCSLLAVAGLGAGMPASGAAADHEITIRTTPGTQGIGWEGTIEPGLQVLLVGDVADVCNVQDASAGDRETIQINVPAIDPRYDVTAVFSIDWEPQSGNGGVQDEKLVVLGPDGTTIVGESDTGGQTFESTPITLVKPGVYTVVACAFQSPTPTPYNGALDIYVTDPVAHVATGVPTPLFTQFTAPKALAAEAGEPSIGYNPKTDATMFQANVNTYNVKFDDAKKSATWTDVTPPKEGITTLDPILFTDRLTGRTFVSQLVLMCSIASFSDTDGGPWVPSQGCGEGTALDHQSLGGGPYPATFKPAGAAYPDATYYCAQGAVAALCATSFDGGLTFGNAVPAIQGECGVLHGHLKVAPDDGTVYLPASNCQGKQGVAVSTDAGLTWKVKPVPDAIAGTSDPSVGVGADGTVYFGFSDGSGKPKVAVSTDHGDTWAPSVDVGITPFSVKSTEFALMVAGDGDRAAFAFMGSPTDGDFQAPAYGVGPGDKYTGGAWHMYVAITYDRGKTWTTVDGTPGDPVQRGCMWNRGGGSDCRNLLDFNDVTIDKIGRVMVGFADGCTSYVTPCSSSLDVGDNKREAHGAILRQETGKTLFAEFDGTLPGSGVKPVTGGTGGTGGNGGSAGRGGSGSGPSAGPIATTGLPAAVPVAGVLLLLLALLPARRRRTRAAE